MKRITMTAVGTLAVVGVMWCFNSWLFGPSCANTPREMFEGTLLRPVPDGVSDIEGAGDMGQSYNLWLRFRATDAAISQIIAKGFIPESWGQLAERFRLPSGYDRFSPRWSPQDAETKECYWSGRSCPWSMAGGRQWLLIDRKTGTVYVYATGG